jgi:hypothetical protein
VREHVRFLEHHLVDVVMAIVARLHEHGNRAEWDTGCILVTHHLGHGHSAPPRDGIQERLSHAVSDRSMERCSVDGECIDLARNITKRGELPASKQGCDVTLDGIDGRTCQEDWGASADTRILHGSTVAMGDLTVIQEEQHGHGLAGLTDAPKAGRRRPTAGR